MKKMICFILCVISLCLVGCSAQQSRNTENTGTTKPSTSSQTEERYLRIDLSSETMGETLKKYINADTVVANNAVQNQPTKLPIYQIKKHVITEEEFQRVQEQIDVPENTSSRPKWKLKDNVITGYFTVTGDAPFTKSDEEVEAIARKIFNQLTLLEGEYEYHGIFARRERGNSEGDTHLIEVSVAFCRVLNGIRVIGNNQCTMTFDANGLISICLELYDYEQIGAMNLVPMEEAEANIITPDGFTIENNSNGTGPADSLEVNQIKMVFYNHYDRGCTILHPVYHFEGVATLEDGTQASFTSRIIATPESMTYEAEGE